MGTDLDACWFCPVNICLFSLSSKKKEYKPAPNKKRKKISIDEISPSAFNTKEKMNDKNIIINNINIVNNNNDITLYKNNHRKLTNKSKSFISKLNSNIKNDEKNYNILNEDIKYQNLKMVTSRWMLEFQSKKKLSGSRLMRWQIYLTQQDKPSTKRPRF